MNRLSQKGKEEVTFIIHYLVAPILRTIISVACLEFCNLRTSHGIPFSCSLKAKRLQHLSHIVAVV